MFVCRRLIKIIFIFLLCINIAAEDKVVAKVGDTNIYQSEFKERFDFSIHPNLLQNKNKDEAKLEFLKQLIAEKLLSLKAKQYVYDTTEVFKNIINPLNDIFVRDALYTTEIKSKSKVSEKEIAVGIERNKKVLLVKFFYSKNEEELAAIYKLLSKGASFDSLLSLRPESANQLKVRKVMFGDMDEDIENILYKLKPGEYTKPLSSKDGFYILKLVGIEKNSPGKDPQTVTEDVKRIVETRVEYKKYISYYRNLFSAQKVTADKTIFEELVKALFKKFKEKYALPDTSKIFLRGGELQSCIQSLRPETLKEIFIKIPGEPVNTKQFINQLSNEGLYVKSPDDLNIRSSLASYIRKFIEDKLLTIEGEKKKLGELAEVKKYMNMWEDAYLSKMLMMSIFDSVKVSDDEAYNVYKSDNKLPLEKVNIVEVLTDSLKNIETIFSELSKGRSLKQLAMQYTKRDSLRVKGGEFGLFPITEHGAIGKIASTMRIGDIYGPIKLKEGYSIFQLIDKVEDTTKYSDDFNSVKDEIILNLTLIKFETYVNNYNANLAKKYGVKINDPVLKETENSFLNLVVVRYMGFGGEIFAVPYTEQFPGWYEIWRKNQNLNP